MRVLVTGASGMLGRAVAARLLATGHEVRTFQRHPARLPGAADVLGSVTDPGAVARAVGAGTRRADAVVHLAAKVSVAGPEDEFHAVNVGGTAHLLAALAAASVPRLVFVSSPSVAHLGTALVGAPAGPADPVRARGAYARTKAAAELIALARDGRTLPDGSVLRVAVVRPHVVWGPGDTQLVARVVDRARAGRLPLLDHGAALIDTTYVDNAAAAICRALDRIEAAHGEPVVVTNGEPRPVAELIGGICRAAGVPAPRWRVPGRLARLAGAAVEAVWAVRPGADEPPMTRFLAEQLSTAHWFDQRRTRELLDWRPEVTLAEGMTRLAGYYRSRPGAPDRVRS